MDITNKINEMKKKEESLRKEKEEKLILAQSKKRLESSQKGRWFILEFLKEKGFNVIPKMKEKESAIQNLKLKLDDGKELKLNVHTHPENEEGYILNERDEKNYNPTFFHVFVDFVGKEVPDFWIIPSEIVSNIIKDAHIKWLESPGKKGQKHNDSPIRVFVTKNDSIHSENLEKELEKYYKNFEILRTKSN